MDKPFYLKGIGDNIINNQNISQFKKSNPELSNFIENYKIELKVLNLSYFESFCAWILSQQISGHVAEILFKRFKALVGEVTPQKVKKVDKSEFLNIGFSKSKVEYIQNVSKFFVKNKTSEIDTFSNKKIMDIFTKIKGVGPWTVNMFLIFNLGRLNVKAPNDLVIRKGIERMYNLPQVPSIKEAAKIIDKWGEFSTIGCILSWAVMGE